MRHYYFVSLLWVLFSTHESIKIKNSTSKSGIDSDWLAKAILYIKKDEYRPRYLDMCNGITFKEKRLHVWNRENDFHAFFDNDKIEILPRKISENKTYPWNIKIILSNENKPELKDDKIKYKNLEIENSEEGLIIYSKGINFSPSDLKIEYENLTKEVKEKEIIFNFDNEKLLKFNFENGLIKISAFNKKEIRYEVLNEKDLSQTPNWTADPTDQDGALFGYSV
ncbi:MAG: hypothetical protein ABDH37_04630, partial [Candidatus Hydrothermales bacterium]